MNFLKKSCFLLFSATAISTKSGKTNFFSSAEQVEIITGHETYIEQDHNIREQIEYKTFAIGCVEPYEKHRIETIIARVAALSMEEYCKVRTLLSWDMFRIDLIDGKDIKAAQERGVKDNMAAAFNWKTCTVTIYTDAPDSTIEKYLIHEFNHAIDSYNNLKNGFVRLKLANNKIVGHAFFALNSRSIGSNENLSIKREIYRQNINLRLQIEAEIDSAIATLKRPIKSNPDLHQELQRLVKNKNYRYIRYYGKDVLPITPKEMQHMLTMDKFIRFSGASYDIWVTSMNDRGYFEFLKSDPSLKPSVSTIKKDLFNCLIDIKDLIKTEYEALYHSAEYNAWIQQYFAAYPKLLGILFPKLMDHRQIQHSHEMRQCLRI